MECLASSTWCVYGPFPATSPAGGNFLGVDACYSQGYRSLQCRLYNHLSKCERAEAGWKLPLSFYQAAGQWRGYSGPTNDQWEVALGNICIVYCGPGFVGDVSLTGHARCLARSSALGAGYIEFHLPANVGTSGVLSFVPRSDVSVPPIIFLDGIDLEEAPDPGTLLTFGSLICARRGWAARHLHAEQGCFRPQ